MTKASNGRAPDHFNGEPSQFPNALPLLRGTSLGHTPPQSNHRRDGAFKMVILGTAQYAYEVAEPWAQLPEGWSFREVAAVGVDAQDNVYAFNRGAHPMMAFDRQGHFLRSWGEGVFTRAHGISMGPDATVFCTCLLYTSPS